MYWIFCAVYLSLLTSSSLAKNALKQTLSQPNCPNSHFFTQHQHSPPAHIVIPAVNPISATRLSTSSHENNASPQQRNVLPLQTTWSLIFRTPSTWLHQHTWKTTIIIHIVHPYLVLRPFKLGSAYTIGRPCISISYALHAQAALVENLRRPPWYPVPQSA